MLFAGAVLAVVMQAAPQVAQVAQVHPSVSVLLKHQSQSECTHFTLTLQVDDIGVQHCDNVMIQLFRQAVTKGEMHTMFADLFKEFLGPLAGAGQGQPVIQLPVPSTSASTFAPPPPTVMQAPPKPKPKWKKTMLPGLKRWYIPAETLDSDADSELSSSPSSTSDAADDDAALAAFTASATQR